MKDIFNFSGGRDDIPEEFRDLSLKDHIKTYGPFFLQMESEARLEEGSALKARIEAEIEKGFQQAAEELRNGDIEQDLKYNSEAVMGITREQISENIENIFNTTCTDIASMEKHVKFDHTLVRDMTEGEFAGFIKALTGALPPRLESVVKHIAAEGGDLDQAMREFHRMSIEDKAQARIERNKRLPKEEIISAIHEMTQKATPDNIRTFASEILTRLKPEDVSAVIFNGRDFLKDLIVTVMRDDSFSLQNPAKAREFQGDVKKLLTAVEDSLAVAGIMPDTDLKAALNRAFPPKMEPVNENAVPALKEKIMKTVPKGTFKL
jgi:hypothetical protein